MIYIGLYYISYAASELAFSGLWGKKGYEEICIRTQVQIVH